MIRFYGAENCPKCDAKKEELKEKGIEYAYADAKYIDINKDIDVRPWDFDANLIIKYCNSIFRRGRLQS